MKCTQCQTELPDSARFCMNCGRTLQTERLCAHCRHPNPLDARFCLQCGRTFVEPVPPIPQQPPTSFVAGRYTVKSFLGEGGMKKVYLSQDNLLGREVAFALLKTDTLGEEAKVRIKREAQTMARLGDHPNILTVHDMGESDGQIYMVMPVMSGGRVADLIASEPNNQLGIARTIEIAKCVCRGLNHAHSRGIIHRDLKPSNIFLNLEGSALIGDFGLALAVELSRLTQSGVMMGTASYISPEQATGGETTQRSDYYSLGVMLYEMVTGKLPFTGDDLTAVVSQHINMQPVLPSHFRAEIPDPLETLIVRLLEKDPNKRPASASDILERLEAIDMTGTTQAPLRKTASSPDFANQRVFVGRESELRQLESDFERAASGRGRIVMIEGEPGIGKSALCEKLATYVAIRSCNTLWGYCQESSIPYMAFVGAMRSYVIDASLKDLKKKLGPTAADVARIVPELKSKLKTRLRAAGDPQEDRYRLMQAVSGFLQNIAQSKPLLVIIEDLHVADRGSLEMLAHVARTLEKAPLLIVGTLRDNEMHPNQDLVDTLADLQRVPGFRRIKLHELNVGEVGEIIGGVAGQETPRDLATAVYERTEGNPLFVNEVVRYLAEADTNKEGLEKGLKVTGQMIREMGIPEGLHGVISKRLSRLSPDCNRVLSIGSVIGREFRLELLKRLTQMTDAELFAALREAKKATVLEERVKIGAEVTYRFSHDFFRKTTYEEMIGPERINLHQQVAHVLENVYAANREDYAVELAEHFSHSSSPFDLSKAVTYGEMAAKQAQNVYAHGEAIRLWEHTLRVQEALDAGDRAKRCDLLTALGNARINEGEPRRVLDLEAPQAWAMAESLDDPVRSSNVCHLAMLALFYYGIGRAWIMPEAALWTERAQLVAQPNTVASARADTATGIVRFAHGHLSEGVPLLSRAIETVRGLGDNDAYWWAAAMWMLYASGFRHDDELLNMAEELAKGSRDGVSTGVRIWTLVMICDTFLDHARRIQAEEIWREAQTLIERNGQERYQAFSMGGDALFATLDGSLEKAVDIINRLKQYGNEMGFTELSEIIVFMAGIRPLIYLGMAEKAIEYFPAIESPAPMSLCLAHQGKLGEANELLEKEINSRYGERYDESTDESSVYGDVLLLETAVLVGNNKAAGVLLRRLAKCKSRTTGVFHATCIDRHMGAAASLLGRYDQAREYYLRALEISSQMRFRPEVALTRLQIAELSLDHFPEESDQAVKHLDFVISEFKEMKMSPSLERSVRRRRTLKKAT